MEKLQLLEKRWYQDPGFPCSVLTIRRDKLLFPVHWHDELEMLYAPDCRIEVTIDGECLPLPQGAALIVNSGQLHSARLPEGQHGALQLLVFHPEIWLTGLQDLQLTGLVQSILQGNLFLPTIWLPQDPAATAFLASLTRLICLGRQTFDGQTLAMRGELYLMLAGIVSRQQILAVSDNRISGRHHQAELIRRPIQYIHHHFQQNLKLTELAALANLSESHFSRVFRQVLGQSVVTYINDYRIQQAARMLDGTDARITDIALECGYPNLSYFVRCFRRQFDMTPSAYRRRLSPADRSVRSPAG